MITETNIKRVGSRICPAGTVVEKFVVAREANAGFNCQSFSYAGERVVPHEKTLA